LHQIINTMPLSDVLIVTRWWLMFLAIGILFLPLTLILFSRFFDKGYVFSKALGMGFISYVVFTLGVFKILPFTQSTIYITAFCFLIINLLLISKLPKIITSIKCSWKMFLLEEIVFLATFIFWSYIRAHQPDIHGLEKYEDFGFINSILRSTYFPPRDMWFTPFSINYYYFGHIITAVLTKLSGMASYLTFNLMLSTVFALSFTEMFSIGINLFSTFLTTASKKISSSKIFSISAIVGLLSAFLATLGGNLHTIYAFFKPYVNDHPAPFWRLEFSPQTFPNLYWYPNATRFIYNTIHEFPPYSFVVSDLHAHVLDMPFVFLAIAVFLSIFLSKNINLFKTIFVSFLLAIMYMTNAWDGPIYLLFMILVIFAIQLELVANFSKHRGIRYYILNTVLNKKNISKILPSILVILAGFFFFSLPFNINFKPFTPGVGILCAPKFLTDIGKIGPLLFEANHCQQSPLWQLVILYGFFYFWVTSFGVFIFSKIKSKHFSITDSDIFVGLLIILSTLLIFIPEFAYVKDIYPTYYRANTMFKLIFQAFIMLSLSSAYIIMRLFLEYKSEILDYPYRKLAYWVIGLSLLALVSIYPYFSINSYFGNLKIYYGLNGTNYLRPLYPNDYEAIQWINTNIKGQPVVLEAQGDSYSDFARVSTNTGLPTVLGWTVHEWLWRGTYDIPAPRIGEVEKLYESKDLQETKSLLAKYNVALVFIGDLERQKYKNINEKKFGLLGKIIFKSGNTEIYKIN